MVVQMHLESSFENPEIGAVVPRFSLISDLCVLGIIFPGTNTKKIRYIPHLPILDNF